MSEDRLIQALGVLERERLDEEDRRLESDSRLVRSPTDSVRQELLAAIGGIEEVPGPATPTAPAGRRMFRWLAAAVALFALLGTATLWPTGGAEPLPMYALHVSGRDAPVRGGAAPNDVVLSPGSTLTVQIQPRQAVEGAVGVRGFVRSGDHLRVLPVELSPNEKGVVAVRAPAVDVLGVDQPGQVELVFVVARPDQLPDNAVVSGKLAHPPAEWQVLTHRVRIIPAH